MEKGEVSLKLGSIKDKLVRIKAKQDLLEADNAQLKEKAIQLELELKEAKTKSQNLEKNYDRVKLAKTLVSSTGDKAEMKFRVNELVREIDKCIALLNR
ncbi:MAG: CO/xanthine dehydrogenase FAD-binding subunit [Cryomorphaceae bacterium]|jgi:CO/xanthine dehydrogenase FAD-binding subunit